jgi:hypothetical protein
VLKLDPLGSWALGLLGTWDLALLDLERLFAVVGVVISAFSLLHFCGTSLQSGCKVLRFDPLGSWARGLWASWPLGLLGSCALGTGTSF